MTPIIKTPAIVLRYVPFSNSSRIVTWLTPDHGRIGTMIKGSLRPKSQYLGQYDLFYTCELLYYGHHERELYTARECTPLQFRTRFRTDWRAMSIASYFVDLMGRVCPANAPHPELYHLLAQHLDELDKYGAFYPLVFWFELNLLDELGLTPRLQNCALCTQALIPGKNPVVFSNAHGGMCCTKCHPGETRTLTPVSADILAILQGWQRAENPRMARTTHCTNRQLTQIQLLLGGFMRYHLDTPLISRKTAFDIMDFKV